MSALRAAILVLLTVACSAFPSQPEPDKPYLILISIDGLGAVELARFAPPVLESLAARGVRADGLKPVFPVVTFPNHLSIATGLYPAEHGIVDNSFPSADRTRWYRISDHDAVGDGSWYRGEPIWVTAEKAGTTAAAFYFVGTEAPIMGTRPTYWRRFDESVPGEDRVDQVLQWLDLPDEQRPRMLTLYFGKVDSAAHRHGTSSDAYRAALNAVDDYLGRLISGLETRGLADQVHLIVVSDHGQVDYVQHLDPFVVGRHADLTGIDVVEYGSYLAMWGDGGAIARLAGIRDAINANWRNGRAYLKPDYPSHWNTSQDRRFPDLVAIADLGYRVVPDEQSVGFPFRANHGWDPSHPEQFGIFIAAGPTLPQGRRIEAFENTQVNALMRAILGLPVPPERRSDAGRLLELLLKPQPMR